MIETQVLGLSKEIANLAITLSKSEIPESEVREKLERIIFDCIMGLQDIQENEVNRLHKLIGNARVLLNRYDAELKRARNRNISFDGKPLDA